MSRCDLNTKAFEDWVVLGGLGVYVVASRRVECLRQLPRPDSLGPSKMFALHLLIDTLYANDVNITLLIKAPLSITAVANPRAEGIRELRNGPLELQRA